MRSTIHVVSAGEFWRYAMGVRQARRAWALRMPGPRGDETGHIEAATQMREALADGPRTVKELGELGAGFVGNLGLWVDLVRVPPSGTWERRRADRLALAEDWVGPVDASEDEGLEHLVRAYLRGFGPAAWRDIASWAGISVSEAKRGGEGLTLARYRDEDGRELIDLEDAPLPDPTRRRRSDSCPTGTRTCSSTPAGRGCCRKLTGRACSASATRSRSVSTSSTASLPAPGPCETAESSWIRTRSSGRRTSERSIRSAKPSRPSTRRCRTP